MTAKIPAILLLLLTPLLLVATEKKPGSACANETFLFSRCDSTEESRSTEFILNAMLPQYSVTELAKNVVYPLHASRNHIEGEVLLNIYLNEEGQIDSIEVDHSDNDIFNEAAIAAARKTTFTPATIDGEGIKYKLPVTIKFRLK